MESRILRRCLWTFGGLGAARAVANRLIYMVKDEGITVLITAISEGDDPQTEATELQISTVADTWIHLSYIVRSGERNRALTIIKSRGTWHSTTTAMGRTPRSGGTC